MNWPTSLSEFSIEKNKRLLEVRSEFLRALEAQTERAEVAYYDFLLVAKQIGLRFQEAKHLMSLKSYFLQNNNSIEKQKLCNLLMLKTNGGSKDKYIIKFALPHHMSILPPIAQEEEEQEKMLSQEIKKKKQMLLDLKMQQFQKWIPELLKLNRTSPSILFEEFKNWLRLQNMKIFSQENMRIVYECMKDVDDARGEKLLEKLRNAYYSRINEDLLTNIVVLEKKSGTQLLHIIQPNILELQIQSFIVKPKQQPARREETRRKLPAFGPLRNQRKRQKEKQQHMQPSSSTFQKPRACNSKQNIMDFKHKIEKLLHETKSAKKYDFDTNSSRLRRLFIQKVILPFERRNDEQFKKRCNKTGSLHLEVNSEKIL